MTFNKGWNSFHHQGTMSRSRVKTQKCIPCGQVGYPVEWNHNLNCPIARARAEANVRGLHLTNSVYGNWIRACGIGPIVVAPCRTREVKSLERSERDTLRVVYELEMVDGYYVPAWAKQVAEDDRTYGPPHMRKALLGMLVGLTPEEREQLLAPLKASHVLNTGGAVALIKRMRDEMKGKA